MFFRNYYLCFFSLKVREAETKPPLPLLWRSSPSAMEGILYGEVSASRSSRSYALDGRSRRPQSRRQSCVHVGLCGLLQRPESGNGRAKVVHEISSPHAEPDIVLALGSSSEVNNEEIRQYKREMHKE